MFVEENIGVLLCCGREVPCDWQLCLDAAARCDYSISPFYPPMIIISQLLIINLSIVSAWLRKLAKNRVIVNASRSLAKFSSDENIKRSAQQVSPNWFLWHLVWEGIGSHNGSKKGVQITPQLWCFRMRVKWLLAPQSGALRISAYRDFQSQPNPNPSIHL